MSFSGYIRRFCVPIASLALVMAVCSHAADAEEDIVFDPVDPLCNGHLLLEVRPRYTVITDTTKPEKTEAWTLRTRWAGARRPTMMSG